MYKLFIRIVVCIILLLVASNTTHAENSIKLIIWAEPLTQQTMDLDPDGQGRYGLYLKEQFEREVQQAGIPEFKIWQKSSDGKRVPATGRAVYYPILYVEPFAGNESMQGFDLGSDQIQQFYMTTFEIFIYFFWLTCIIFTTSRRK